MRKPIASLLAALACGLGFAGSGHAARLQPDLSDVSSLPLTIAATGPVDKALKQVAAGKSSPLTIGVVVPLSMGLAAGRWDSPSPGIARWRSRVLSSGAKTMSFEFSRFDVPASAELWVYDAEGRLLQGPYTAAQRSPAGGLWTAVISGDTAVLELRLPSADRAKVALEVASISHNYRGFPKVGLSGESAGTCNIDVAASQGNDYRNEIRGVGVYTVRVGTSNAICTGQLVNNFRQDSTPYFLTANHCGITSTNAATIQVYWNFQRSACGTGDGDLAQSQTGATFRASNATADFALVQLSSTPSTDFNVRYAGFDASGAAPQSGASIHHPAGDVKKISLFTTTSCSATVNIDGRSTDGWAVRWAQGTTEQGSSGGGLLDQNKRLVGVLSGGDAFCGNISGVDYFGRLARAWIASSSSNGQLKAWLDPDNSGRVVLCSQNPGAPCDTAVRTSGSTAPGTVTTAPAGSPATQIQSATATACSGSQPAAPSPANPGGGSGCGAGVTPTNPTNPTNPTTPTTNPNGSNGGGLGLSLLAPLAWLGYRRRWLSATRSCLA